MNDTEAMQHVEAGLRALFDSFVRRSIQTNPQMAEQLKAIAGEVLAGYHGLHFQIEVHPVAGITLNCGIAQEHNLAMLSRIFDAHPVAGIPCSGAGLCN